MSIYCYYWDACWITVGILVGRWDYVQACIYLPIKPKNIWSRIFPFKCRKMKCWVGPCVARSVHPPGTGSGQPAGRGLHQRPAAAQPHPTQDSGDGPSRDPALRHLPTAARVSRLRLQNPLPLPGDRLHPARGHRRQQAQGAKTRIIILIQIILHSYCCYWYRYYWCH